MDDKNKRDDFVELMRKELTSIIDSKTSTALATRAKQKAIPEVEVKSQIFDVEEAESLCSNTSRKEVNVIKSTKASKLRAATVKKSTANAKKQPVNKAKTDSRKAEIDALLTQKLENAAPLKEPTKEDTLKAAQMKLDNLKFLTSGTERAKRMEFLDGQAGKNIDEDLQKMQLELKQSYELFQSIGNKFSSIDFSMLKNRIRDLHLNKMNNFMMAPSAMELRQDFEKHCLEKRLGQLTSSVGNGFRRHPGEFGDIPELSAFFQACTQLEHGLDNLKKQRARSNDLGKRLCWASEIAYERMDEIRNAVGQSPTKDF